MHSLLLLLPVFPHLVYGWTLPEAFINDASLVPRQGCADPSLLVCGLLCCRPGSLCLEVAGVQTCCSPGVPCAKITGACSASSDPMAKCLGYPSFCCPQGAVCATHAPTGVECNLDLAHPPGPDLPSTTTTTSSTTSALPTPTGPVVLNNDPGISFKPDGAWSPSNAPICAKSPSIQTTTTPGSTISLKFSGGIAIRTINTPDGGVYTVSVNGGAEQTINTYSPSDTPSCVFSFSKPSLAAAGYMVLVAAGCPPTASDLTIKFPGGPPIPLNTTHPGNTTMGFSQAGNATSRFQVDFFQTTICGFGTRDLPNLWLAATVAYSVIAISLI